MLNLSIEMLFISLALFMVIFIVIFIRQGASYRQRIDIMQSQNKTQDILTNELQNNHQALTKQLLELKDKQEQQQLENEQVSKQLEHRIKMLQQQISSQEQTVEQIQAQQPEDKLYSRAFKLVELGADIEEVMKECEIPRAEAEMLLSVHQKKTNR
jgi:uncharacterized protein HemX